MEIFYEMFLLDDFFFNKMASNFWRVGFIILCKIKYRSFFFNISCEIFFLVNNRKNKTGEISG